MLMCLRLCSIGFVEQRADVSFEDVGVTSTALLENIAGMGIERPTHVQVMIALVFRTPLFCCFRIAAYGEPTRRSRQTQAILD